MEIVLRDGEPCKHRGCKNHFTHKCEVCGRIGARGEKRLLKATYFNKI